MTSKGHSDIDAFDEILSVSATRGDHDVTKTTEETETSDVVPALHHKRKLNIARNNRC